MQAAERATSVLKSYALAIFLGLQGAAFAMPVDGFAPVAQPVADVQLLRLAQDGGQLPVKPSQAALIAQHATPGSTVLDVVLQGGVYAVKLKVGNSVQKVMVNATTGQLG